MLYRSKCVVVEATRLTAQVELTGLMGEPGDWLVIGANGQPSVMVAEDFFKHFEPSDDETETPTRFAQEKKPRVSKPRVKKNGLDAGPLPRPRGGRIEAVDDQPDEVRHD